MDGRHIALAGRGLGAEGVVVAVPGGVVGGVGDQAAVGAESVAGGGQQGVEVVVDLVDRHRVVLDQVVELVAQLEPDEVRAAGERAAEGAQEGGLGLDGVRVGEDVAVVPTAGPLRIEVEARQMALHAVHHDVEPCLAGQVHEARQLVDGGGADEGAVGLQQRPEVEDADVVDAQIGYPVQVLTRASRVEVVPGVEPAVAGRVVDAEAERVDGILLAGPALPGSGPALGLVQYECINHHGRR